MVSLFISASNTILKLEMAKLSTRTNDSIANVIIIDKGVFGLIFPLSHQLTLS